MIDGKSTLIRVINNTKKVKYINKIILSTKSKQWLLCKTAENEKIFHRGSEENVYKRVAEAHKKMESDVLVTVWQTVH